MNQKEPPSVSVVIVTWNHGHLVEDCLDALQAQDYAPLNITVVDNGSQDGTAERVAMRYPAVALLPFPDNTGFAHAFNEGARRSSGDMVLSLNPDVTVRAGFVQEMVQALGHQADCGANVGAVAPKLLQAVAPGVLDSTGLFVDRRRRPHDRGQGERDAGQYDAQPFVWGACGAAALYRRAMLDDVAVDGEYFDEVFWAYCEDADLAWRAQWRGWRCVYAPRAVATHDRGWGDTLRRQGRAAKDVTGPRLALRNRYLMAINDVARWLLADLPQIVAAELPRLGYAAVTQPRYLLGLLDLARAFPDARRKRRIILGRRKVDGSVVRPWFVDPAGKASEC